MTAELYILSIQIAICAFVYVVLLTEPYYILGDLYGFLEPRLPWWLFKPMMGCEKCVAGQLALWIYLYQNYKVYDLYHACTHIFFICLTIITTHIITLLMKWLKNLSEN